MYRKIVIGVFIFLLGMAGVAAAASAPRPESLEAEAALLMVAGSKQVLYDKNGHGIMYPASTTKLMTLITALEQSALRSIITVSPQAAECEESRLGLAAGDQLTLADALYGLMLVSGNDAAEAIAEHVAGSVPNFVKVMNAKAERIGVEKTHFSNPHGLPDPYNHFATAYDLALITEYGMQNPMFARIVGTREYNVRFLNGKIIHVKNTNRLLRSYRGAIGGKTGFTNDAGDCLVAVAQRGNVQLIVVILNSDERWSEAAALLDYGFAAMGAGSLPGSRL